MSRFIIIKLVRALITIMLAITAVFFVLRLSGDPLAAILSDDVPESVRDAYRERLGLDQPIWVQYGRYMMALVQGDLGQSVIDGRSAVAVVLERVPATLLLGAGVLFVGLLIGIPAGIVAAVHRGGIIDRLVMSGAVFGYAMPSFFLGILMIMLFSLQLRWLPSSGYGTLAHLVMPALTLGTGMAGKLGRFVRTAVLDVISQHFVSVAHGMRLPPLRVMLRHVLPNAAIPVITFLGFEFGLLIGGAVVAETVFGWPGIGHLLSMSVARRDLAIVQVIILFIAASIILANLLVDLAYGWVDPRARQSGDQS